MTPDILPLEEVLALLENSKARWLEMHHDDTRIMRHVNGYAVIYDIDPTQTFYQEQCRYLITKNE